MATGSASISFGTAPGTDYASVDVTGLSGLTAGSYLEAFTMTEAAGDGTRSADDNRVDPVDLSCEYLSATSFRIHAQARLGNIIGTVPVRYATA